MRTTLLILFITLLTLTGCASMSKDECLTADWETVGFEDGAAGRSVAYIGERRQACAKHGVTPNKTAYDAGYDKGILNFCNYGRGRTAAIGGYTPNQVCPEHSEYQNGFAEGLDLFCTYDSGYDHGLAGRQYHRTCPAGLEDEFMEGYNTGSHINSLQNQLYALEHELSDVEAHREANDQDQTALKQQLILDDKLTAAQRTQILLDIEALRDEDDDLEDQKDYLLVQIGDVQAQLRGMGVEI